MYGVTNRVTEVTKLVTHEESLTRRQSRKQKRGNLFNRKELKENRDKNSGYSLITFVFYPMQ